MFCLGRPKAPMHVLVKEIYDMVPLESGEEDIEDDDDDDDDDEQQRHNGKIANKEESRGGRKSNNVDHADDDSWRVCDNI